MDGQRNDQVIYGSRDTPVCMYPVYDVSNLPAVRVHCLLGSRLLPAPAVVEDKLPGNETNVQLTTYW